MTSKTRRSMATAALIALVAAGAAAGEIGRCFTAELPTAVTLPDGTHVAAGVLKICTTARYSPVATLHTVYRDGLPLGLFTATVREIEGDSAELAVFVFSRKPSSETLVLEGLAASSGSSIRTYLFGSRGRVETRAWFASAKAPHPADEGWVTVAARRP